jgi:hypothetical protein
MNTKITLFVVCILLIIGCSHKEKRVPKDKFYAFTGGWGEMSIPLIKPFYLFCFDGKGWMLEEDDYTDYERFERDCSIFDVKRINASDSLFLFRSYGGSGVSINGRRQLEGWFIVSIQNKTINGYTDYEAFRDTVFSKFQITIDTLSWRTPKSYYKEFKKEGIMPWFPDSIW